MTFDELVSQRWEDVQDHCDVLPVACEVTWDVKDGVPHFAKKRGYAVCYHVADGHCHLRFSPKIHQTLVHRADGLIRHELGHAVDFFVPSQVLNAWAQREGFLLPATPERRADMIALILWQEPIRYDTDLVQSTRLGQYPRPAHLGL